MVRFACALYDWDPAPSRPGRKRSSWVNDPSVWLGLRVWASLLIALPEDVGRRERKTLYSNHPTPITCSCFGTMSSCVRIGRKWSYKWPPSCCLDVKEEIRSQGSFRSCRRLRVDFLSEVGSCFCINSGILQQKPLSFSIKWIHPQPLPKGYSSYLATGISAWLMVR